MLPQVGVVGALVEEGEVGVVDVVEALAGAEGEEGARPLVKCCL